MNNILDIWLIIAVVIVVLVGGFKFYKHYLIWKINRGLIQLHNSIPIATKDEIKQIKRVVDNIEKLGLANQKHIVVARLLIKIRETTLEIR